ncbi:MAG: LamG domain-containing protein, partial [Patescibacteria group bacterium]|nr:LamG domain-containing protein [Patescibacteria group bacterium]
MANTKFPTSLIATIIFAGLFLAYIALTSTSANHFLTFMTTAPETQLAQVSGSSCATGDLTCGLVAWWKLADGSGTSITDSSGSGDTGLFVNSPSWTTDAAVGNGAVSFEGSNGYIKIPTAPTISQPYSVSMWFYPTATSTYQGLLFYGLNTADRGILFTNTIQILSSSAGTFRTFCNKTFTSPDLNKWHHVVVIVNSSSDASKWQCYLDGSNVGVTASNSSGTYADPGNANWTLGTYYNNSYWFHGMMDDVRIYSRALSAQEVSSLYALGTINPVSAGSSSTSSASSTIATSTSSTSNSPSSNEITASSCSLSDVQAAINAVSSGGTVDVPSGNCTWNSGLTITRPIVLVGAGAGLTTITSNYPTNAGFITYRPLVPSANDRFRITGFTFNNGGKSTYMLYPYNDSITPEYIRIDHNAFNLVPGAGSARAIGINGTIFGVADDNDIYLGDGMSALGFAGTNYTQWASIPRSFGAAENFYFEDNTITGSGDVLSSGGQGGRYVVRYNSYESSLADLAGIFDQHGNQPGGTGCVNT